MAATVSTTMPPGWLPFYSSTAAPEPKPGEHHAGWEMAVVLMSVTGMLVLMAREYAPADMLMLAMLVAMLALGIIDVEGAVHGFSNPGMLTVAVLLVVAEAVKKTGAIDGIAGLLGDPTDGHQPLGVLLLRLMLPVTVLSAFMNNTPVVAMMIPVLVDFANANGIKASKLLIPLSYASILGGTCTLMGTSTNLVVYGLARDADPGFEMGLFEIGVVGLPVALAGLLYLAVLGPRWLPDREAPFVEPKAGVADYVVTLVVRDPAEMLPGDPAPALVGATIADLSICHAPGVTLAKIEREMTSHLSARTIPRPDRSTELRARDRLFFAGSADRVLALTKKIDPGLGYEYAPTEVLQDAARTLVEVRIGKQSKLVGQTLRELQFRRQYNASVIAVHRPDPRMRAAGQPSPNHRADRNNVLVPVGTFEIRRGDSFLLLAAPAFASQYSADKRDTDFASVHDLAVAPVKSHKAATATALCVGMIIASVAGLHLLTSALVTAVLLVKTGCLAPNDVYAALNLPVLVVIAAAFGISEAMVKSGSAALIARGLVAASGPSGTLGLQIVIYLVTVIFSACVTNNAAVTIMFPIAHKAAEDVGEDFKPYMYLIMMGASASFMTPTGYQTNLMVYGPAGYRFADFLKFGGVLQIWLGVVTIGVMQTLVYWWVWSLFFAGALGVVALSFLRDCMAQRATPRGGAGAGAGARGPAPGTGTGTPPRSPSRRRRPRRNSTGSGSELTDDLVGLNLQAKQRYRFVPDLGLVPIESGESGDDDDDDMLGTLDVPLHGHRQETEALI